MISVEGLSKYYGAHAALRDISFTIDTGEVVGFLGLNGAGKTTTLKVVGCVLLPTSGKVVIDGIDATREPHELKKRIGFLPDTPPLYDEMPVGEYLAFVARLRGVPAADVPARVAEAEKKTALLDKHHHVIGTLSHGYRQRVGLAQALVHKPKLLVLDEPTGGLDPVQIVEMRELIRGLKGDHTVLVSSHILGEISQVCDRYLVIQGGELIARGTEAELAQQLGGGKVAVELTVRGGAQKAVDALKREAGVAAVEVAQLEGDQATLRVEAAADCRPALVRALVSAQLDVLRVDRAAAGLEHIFLGLTKGKDDAR